MIDLKSTLENARTIAVVGCSNRPSRTSYTIAEYLQGAGYRIIPVNPTINEVFGERSYPNLQSIPEEIIVDIVDIFRRPDHTAGVVKETVEYAEATGMSPTIWTQLDVSSPEAERLAQEAGLPYVRNRCIFIEHRRLFG